jgi:hypothetical protein
MESTNLRDEPKKCRDCDKPAIQYGVGGNGPFCKECYIKWADSIAFLLLPPK